MSVLVIKYLGSKRRLVSTLGSIANSIGATTAIDLFTGTTRVAQEFKQRGMHVTACDIARYSEMFAQCYIETDSAAIDTRELQQAIAHLNEVPGTAGYITETFCIRSRYFQPFNGERIDAIRQEIEREFRASDFYSILLTSLIEAADRVDSTVGVQMAYVKNWSTRSYNRLELRPPELLAGPGNAIRGDVLDLVEDLDAADIVYLDPPYNQHRYFTNYHIWETLVAWDHPDHYGVACKRVDSQDESTKSIFNKKRSMPAALRQTIASVSGRLVVISYNDESWIELEELIDMCSAHGHVEVLAFDSKRYVGAQIGVHDHKGEKVGEISHLRNVEYVLVAGDREDTKRAVAPFVKGSRRMAENVFA